MLSKKLLICNPGGLAESHFSPIFLGSPNPIFLLFFLYFVCPQPKKWLSARPPGLQLLMMTMHQSRIPTTQMVANNDYEEQPPNAEEAQQRKEARQLQFPSSKSPNTAIQRKGSVARGAATRKTFWLEYGESRTEEGEKMAELLRLNRKKQGCTARIVTKKSILR